MYEYFKDCFLPVFFFYFFSQAKAHYRHLDTTIPSTIFIFFLSSTLQTHQDPPMVNLRLGSTLSADDIKEGDDVYFECHVQANPPWRKLLWLHDVSITFSPHKFLNPKHDILLSFSSSNIILIFLNIGKLLNFNNQHIILISIYLSFVIV